MIETSEKNPLKWPDSWERTRIQDRKPRAGWKKNFREYRQSLVKEMERMGVTSMVISYNQAGQDRMDCGVAVWFSKSQRQDFAWQDALGLLTPAPTLEQIDSAYREKAMLHHPDRGGDIETFRALTAHRNQARAWVLGKEREDHDYVIPCDRFNESRLNLAAIRMAIAAMRTLDRVGIPGILERSFVGFKAALPAHKEDHVAVPA